MPGLYNPKNGRTPDLAEVRGLPWGGDVKDTRNPTADTQPCPSDRDRQPEHAVSHISVPYLQQPDRYGMLWGSVWVEGSRSGDGLRTRGLDDAQRWG